MSRGRENFGTRCWAAIAALLVVTTSVPCEARGSAHPACPSAATLERAARIIVAVSSGSTVPNQAIGFVVPSGRILTVAHAIRPAAETAVGRPGRQASAVRVVSRDLGLDAAVLSGSGAIASSRAVLGAIAVAPACVAVATVRAGRVAIVPATARRLVHALIDAPVPAVRASVQLEASLSRGDSGAPVLDRAGRVVGMVFAVAADGSATGWATSASELTKLDSENPPAHQ